MHLVDQNAERPPVHRATVALVQQNLWSDVLGSPADRVGAFAHGLREPEVDHLEVATRADHDVLGFQVAVADVL